MNAKELSYGLLRAAGIALGIILLLFFLYEIQSVIVYIAVAAIISLIGRPVVIFLRQRLKIPNQIAVIMCYYWFGNFYGDYFRFVPIVIEQSQYLGRIDIEAFKSDLNDLNGQINAYLGVEEINIISLKQSEFVRSLDVSLIPKFLNNVFGILGATIVALFSVIFISFSSEEDSKLMLNSILVFANREAKFVRVFIKLTFFFPGILWD